MPKPLKTTGLILACAILLLSANAWADLDIQEKVYNHTGKTATNLEKWLEGDVLITDWYQGYGQKFSTFDYGYSPSENYTKLKWSNGTVADGDWTWACVNTNKGWVRQICLPRWTFPADDSLGAGPGLSPGFRHTSAQAGYFAIGNYAIDGGPITFLSVDVGHFATRLSFEQLDYDSLSSAIWDYSLTDQHLALSDSLLFADLTIPTGGSIVWRTRVILDSDPSNVVTYSGQYCPSDQIPTLSEWGMIIFVVLLAGWMAFVVVRRWRAARVVAS